MNTGSWSWPNMFDVARNRVNIAEDRNSIVNRVKLMILTEPSELYMNPTYGVGLKKYMFQYNRDNVIALIKDKIIEQLRLWEPCVQAEKTEVHRGLQYTGTSTDEVSADLNHLRLTVTLYSIYDDVYTIDITEYDLQPD